MKTTIFYKQMRRSVRTFLINTVILLVTTAFFVMSLNLYNSSAANLEQAEAAYRTIAIMELRGDVNRRGELVEPGSSGHKGYLTVAAEGYDIEKIVSSDSVKSYDLRERYGAYIKGAPALQKSDGDAGNYCELMTGQSVIRFTLQQDEPCIMPISWSDDYQDYRRSGAKVYLTVLGSAAESLKFESPDFMCRGVQLGDERSREYYADQVKRLNRSDEADHVILYPGVEYIAALSMSSDRLVTTDSKNIHVKARYFSPNGGLFYFGEDYYVDYDGQTESVQMQMWEGADEPFPIVRAEDLEKDPELKALWEGAWQAMEYNTCAYTICLTDDITGVPVFHLGGTFLADGRMMTGEEYKTGAKVCMVSKELAELQNWKVGDRLDMSFFRFEAFPSSNSTPWGSQPVYHKNTEGFFDAGEYEIVGLFDQRALMGNSGIDRSTLTMAWNTIYLPKSSVQNTLPEEQQPVHGALLTVWLKNGSIDEFLADMDALGITKRAAGQYAASFTLFDQGYSAIQSGLQSMHSTSRLLLILSELLLAITCVLLSWFYAQSQKHTIGIFRMLGGRKAQAAAAVLVCALLVAVLGSVSGAILGHGLSEWAGGRVIAGDRAEEESWAAYRAYVLAAEEEALEELTVQTQLKLSALAACGTLLFPILTLVFVLSYIGKEPRALLPQSKV